MTDSRAWGRAAAALAAVLAVATVAAAVPAALGPEPAPGRSLVELGPENAPREVASSLSGGGLGALSAADAASVGGRTAPGESPLRSQNASVHFVVRSSDPAYWRTGAYGEYTGQGWERTGAASAFDGRFEPGPLRGERVEYRVTLRRPATALPTAWRPARVNVTDGVRRQPGTSLSASTGLSAGTTYVGVSYATARDPAVLRSAGRSYPDRVRRRYLGLPDEPGTRRLASFTDELTADADSPYATATRIERWLEANKAYSLNATHDPSEGTVASQFVFEMETGYCEYYATAMVAMLRTQGVPARYVVGYSTGQQTGPNEYTVRGMNAHAWVEVYFPGVGWVRFDPTPGTDRLSAERSAFADQTGSDPREYAPDETGSPGESFSSETLPGGDSAVGSPNGTVPSDTGADRSGTAADGSRTGTVPDGAAGTVDGTVPGGESTPGTGDGTTPSGSPGAGTPPDGTTAGTASDGSPAGETPDDGTPAGGTPGDETAGDGTPDDTPSDRTPDDGTATDGGSRSDGRDTADPDDLTQSLGDRLTVRLNRTAVPGATVTATVRRDGTPVAGATVTFNGRRVGVTDDAGRVVGRVPYARRLVVNVTLARASAAPGAVGRPLVQSNGTANDSAAYELDTRGNLSVVGDRQPGGEVTVVATVGGVAVRNATVTLDGRRIGRTDANGRITVRLPPDPGEYELVVRRGAVAAERRLELARLRVNRTVGWPLALPGAPVTVSASVDGEPVNATIAVGGERVGATGVDGSRTVRLPVAPRAEIAVAAAGQRVTTTVTGIYATTGGVAGTLLVGLAALAAFAARRGVRAGDVPGMVRRWAARIRSLATRAVIGLAAVLDRVASELVDALRTAIADRDPAAALARLAAAARRGVARLRAFAAGLAATLAAVGITASAGSPAGPDATGDGPTSAREQIRTAWRRFVAALSLPRARSLTPGEVARRAVDRGLPAEPVARLRDAYRAVEYGGSDPERYLSAVREAVAALRGDRE